VRLRQRLDSRAVGGYEGQTTGEIFKEGPSSTGSRGSHGNPRLAGIFPDGAELRHGTHQLQADSPRGQSSTVGLKITFPIFLRRVRSSKQGLYGPQ
jgi:hypothetical protein